MGFPFIAKGSPLNTIQGGTMNWTKQIVKWLIMIMVSFKNSQDMIDIRGIPLPDVINTIVTLHDIKDTHPHIVGML